MLPRIKNLFARYHDTKTNERGFTISAFKSTDAGTVTCGIQPLHEAGITYHGKIWLEVKTSTTNSQSVKILGPSIPKWAAWTMSGFLLLCVAGVVIYFYQKRKKGRYASRSKKRKIEKKKSRKKGNSRKRKLEKTERRQNGKLTKKESRQKGKSTKWKVEEKESREKEKSAKRKVEEMESREKEKSRKWKVEEKKSELLYALPLTYQNDRQYMRTATTHTNPVFHGDKRNVK